MVKFIRIYQAGDYGVADLIELQDAASRHVSIVLRMQVGASLILFNGDNCEFLATIKNIVKTKVTVLIDACTELSRESPRSIHLAQAMSKGERMEFVVQKAVELGVTSITPVLTEHCAIKLSATHLMKKHAQFQAIAIAACEQSGRNKLALINPACSLSSYLSRAQAQIKLILHPHAISSFPVCQSVDSDIILLVGPEGGFSHFEFNLALSTNFKPWHLGARILRTETAAIAAISIMQAIAGDLDLPSVL